MKRYYRPEAYLVAFNDGLIAGTASEMARATAGADVRTTRDRRHVAVRVGADIASVEAWLAGGRVTRRTMRLCADATARLAFGDAAPKLIG